MQSQYQKRINFIVNIIYVLLIVLIVYVALKYAFGLISPFLFAFGIAYILKRPARFISKKLNIPYNLVASVLVLLFYSTIGIIISLLGVKLISTMITVISQFPLIYEEHIAPFFNASFQDIERAVYRIDPDLITMLNDWFDKFVKSLRDNISNITGSVVGTLSNFAYSLPGFLLKVLIMIISTFFIASDYNKLSGFVLRQFSEKGKGVIRSVKNYMINTLFVCIRSYAIIMTVTFMELSIGLSLIGIRNAVLIALVIALFDILPVLGTGGIMLPWTVFTFLKGDLKTGLCILVVYVVITIVRNILEPKIVGSQLGLHPVVTLMCMFIGVSLFGVIGLFGFPITLSLICHLNREGTINIFK